MKKKISNAPMSSAPFVYDKDGKVLWNEMWEKFCALASEGGPSHRGDLLRSKGNDNDSNNETYKWSTGEILRAIKMLTKYKAWDNANGWIGIRLHSKNMAKWFADHIYLENVECTSKGRNIFLPVNDDFTLEKEIKNIVTVLAKADHYWKNHRSWFTKLIIHINGRDIQSVD